MTKFMSLTKTFINKRPNKFSEESVLISTYFQMSRIKSNWFLNTINPPSGEWSELILKKNDKEIKRSFSKNMSRLDLILQNDNTFFLAEAKPNFTSLINQIEKTDDVFEEQKNYIKKILNLNINPIFGYICGLQHSDKSKEINLIKKYLNSSKFSQQLVCVLVCRENDKIKFKSIFADNIQVEIKTEFEKIFS